MTVTYETAVEALKERLGESSVAHSEAVAGAAAELAHIYGVDEASARIAGLLHDWAREEDEDSLLAAAEGSSIDQVDAAVPYLLHAHVGASSLEARFPDLSREILDAVAHHTMGAERMTDLDMVVYIADMIEPMRTFKGVEKLRAAVGDVSLAGLFEMAYARSLMHVIESRKHLHPRSVAVWNSIVDSADVSTSTSERRSTEEV